ncbi:hypothetical protein D3C85_1893950 [compost metagenome]
MDRSTPMSDSSCNTVMLASASLMAVVSVISRVRLLAGKRCVASALATLCTRPAWQNCKAERFTAMRQSV